MVMSESARWTGDPLEISRLVSGAMEQTATRQSLVGTPIRAPIPSSAVALKTTLQQLRDELSSALPDLGPFKWSYGDHRYAAVPWIGQNRHFDPGDPVVALLFATDGSAAYLALHMKSARQGEGVAAFTPQEMAAWAGFHRAEVGTPVGFVSAIDLGVTTGLAVAYAASTICAREYRLGSVVPDGQMLNDWVALFALRERVLSNRPDDDAVRDWSLDQEAANLLNLPLSELRKLAKENGKKRPKRLLSRGSTFRRSAAVVALVRARANGLCDLCGEPAPFADKHGFPFLEAHHIVWLSRCGGVSELSPQATPAG